MRKITIVFLTSLPLMIAACSNPANGKRDVVLLEVNGKELVVADDHVGKKGKEEVKADVIEFVEAL
jgi:hypothetical protein